MKLTKAVITILLLVFVAATVGTLIAQEVARPKMQVAETDESVLPVETSVPATSENPISEQDSVLNEPVPADVAAADATALAEEAVETPVVASSLDAESCVIEAIYFHNTYRCVTCSKIEDEAKAIVEEIYGAELASGRLRWLAINMEDERDYINLYDLAMPSLVLIRKIGNEVVEWITLNETWSQIGSSTRFSAYIRDSFQAFTEECL